MSIEISIITLFPDYFKPLVQFGVVGKSIETQGIDYSADTWKPHFLESQSKVAIKINLVNVSNFSEKSFKGVDAKPFGGGPGMVMRADVLERALKFCQSLSSQKSVVVFPCPRGAVWDQEKAKSMSHRLEHGHFIFIAGRYEGIDERFLSQYVDEFYSLGDFILSGGEVATMAILDSALRLIPGVLGNGESLTEESFENSRLEAPYYTKPRDFNGELVPEVYLKGDPKKIRAHREKESLRLTKVYRPDLL